MALIVMPNMNVGVAAPQGPDMAAYLIMWGIFTALMFVGTLKINLKLQLVFATLTVLFFLLGAAELTGNHMLTTIAGYEGILCGALAIYAGITQVWAELFVPPATASA